MTYERDVFKVTANKYDERIYHRNTIKKQLGSIKNPAVFALKIDNG